MNINSLIINTLSPVQVPVSYQVYTGTATTYITFFEVIDVPALHADDSLMKTQKTIQVDVWSKGNFISTIEMVKTLMKQAGFQFSSGRDLYEDDTKIYHYALTYNYQANL